MQCHTEAMSDETLTAWSILLLIEGILIVSMVRGAAVRRLPIFFVYIGVDWLASLILGGVALWAGPTTTWYTSMATVVSVAFLVARCLAAAEAVRAMGSAKPYHFADFILAAGVAAALAVVSILYIGASSAFSRTYAMMADCSLAIAAVLIMLMLVREQLDNRASLEWRHAGMLAAYLLIHALSYYASGSPSIALNVSVLLALAACYGFWINIFRAPALAHNAA
jgi:hypothetical protein